MTKKPSCTRRAFLFHAHNIFCRLSLPNRFVKKYLLLLFIPLILFAFRPHQAEHNRWDYKLLLDSAGLNAVNATAVSSTVSALDTILRPAEWQRKNRRAEQEKIKVTVDAWLVARGNEDDGDYHLVLQSLDGKETLIAEIPDPGDANLKGYGFLKHSYKQSRHFIDSAIGIPPRRITNLRMKRKVEVTGMLFFDKVSHGNGHAPNGIEIHPVLEIQSLN